MMRVTVSKPRRGLFGPYRAKTIVALWAEEITPLVQKALKARAPVAKEDGGKLRDSIRHRQVNGGGGVTLTFYATVPYAKFVIGGTREHEIRPKAKRALHWKGADGDVFAAVVNHPGTKPNRFPERAIKPLIPVIEQRFKQVSIEALGGQ